MNDYDQKKKDFVLGNIDFCVSDLGLLASQLHCSGSLNLLVLYWYHPPDYWSFLAFSQRVNLQIMREFEKEGIQFAFPTSTTYLTQDDDQPLHISLASTHELPVGE